jgi:isoquinoline 1-oxidoreductase alpha subunit
MVHLIVNGSAQAFDGDPDMPLLWYLRDILGFTGTKFGCGMALCGACTVLENGKAIRSCSTQMKQLEGHEITTIEGVSTHGPR